MLLLSCAVSIEVLLTDPVDLVGHVVCAGAVADHSGAVGGQIVPKPSPGEKVDSKLPVLGQF